jgi:hypothetical protein
MVYTSPLPAFQRYLLTLQFARWWSVDQATSILNNLQSLYFPSHASREAGPSLIFTTLAAPFSVTVRFPDQQIFITDFDPNLSKLISQLLSALAYSDRLLNVTAQRVANPTTSNDPIYLAAKNSYYTALSQLAEYIRDPLNYYDQATFEQTYNLSWS